jgi:hypothetical protein
LVKETIVINRLRSIVLVATGKAEAVPFAPEAPSTFTYAEALAEEVAALPVATSVPGITFTPRVKNYDGLTGTMRCREVFLGVQCNQSKGHHDGHSIGSVREINKFFPQWTCRGSYNGCEVAH